jgi:hypothetical protein
MTPDSRARWSLAVALVAHGVIFVGAPHLRRAKVAPEAQRSVVAASELEIAVEAPTPAPPIEPPPIEPAATPDLPSVAAQTPHAVTPNPPSSDTSERREGNPSEAASGPVASAGDEASATWSFSPTGTSTEAAARGEDEQKLAHAQAAGVGVVVGEWEKKAADRARRPLVLTPQDMALGLVPGGQYASIAREKVRNSTVPVNGHALLEFWTDKKGIVARVRVLNASSDLAAWTNMADSLAEDARSSFPLKIPSNADGLIVTIDVTSALKTIGGLTPSPGLIEGAIRAIESPIDTIMDAKAIPQRIVATKVVNVQAF